MHSGVRTKQATRPGHAPDTHNPAPSPNQPTTRAGDPKGVLLTHSAVVATVISLKFFLDDVLPRDDALGPGDSMLSYLPLAHIFDRCGAARVVGCVCVCLCARACGARA
jgi:long-subunit acyl-CoA synthetase (AMP-forming)